MVSHHLDSGVAPQGHPAARADGTGPQPAISWSREDKVPSGLLQSVERAMRVLDHIARAPHPVAAKDIAKDLGLNLSTTYHLLTTLVQSGYLIHLADECAYGLGHRVNDLTRALHRHVAVPHEVERIVLVCHDEAGAATYYAVLRDAEMVVASVAECGDHPRIQPLDIGFHQAAHATAFGKLMLAALDPVVCDDTLDLMGTPRITHMTLTDRGMLRRQLEQVRESRLAIELGEFQSGLSCMAAPVTDSRHRLLGAVAISMPTDELLRRRPLVERAVRTAAVRATRTVSLAAAVRTGAALGPPLPGT